MKKVPHQLFNPLFWHLMDAMSNPKIRFIYVMGGSSGAKTFTIAQALSFFATGKSRQSALVLRNESTSIDESIYTDFKTWFDDNPEMGRLFTAVRKEYRTAGAKITMKGMDRDKVKGISAFHRIFCDEADQMEYPDWKQLRKRLRGKEGQQLIAAWNPVSEESWLKTEVIDKEEWVEMDMDAVYSPMIIPQLKSVASG